MCDLQIKKGGKLVTLEMDFDRGCFVEVEIPTSELHFYLQDSVCLDRGVVLKDIILLIQRDIKSFSIVTGCPFLDELVEEAFKNINPFEGIYALILQKFMIMENEHINFDCDFYGTGDEEYYPLEFVSVGKLISLPIILNTSVLMVDENESEIQSGLKQRFSLFEILNFIIGELSHVGSSDEANITLDYLKEKYGDDETNYREKIILNFEKRMKENMKNNRVYCKVCGKDAHGRCFGKPIDLCKKCFKAIKEN